MTSKEFKHKARKFFREQLQLADYIDVNAASENIRNNIPFRGPTIYILFTAIVIASVGLNVNSIPVIIGAMLISPLMSLLSALVWDLAPMTQSYYSVRSRT